MTSITSSCFPVASAPSHGLAALRRSSLARVVLGLGWFVVLAVATAACIALPLLCVRARA